MRTRRPGWARWLPWLPAITAALLLVALEIAVTATVGRELESRAMQRVAQAARLYADQLSRVLARRHAEMALFSSDEDLAPARPTDVQRAALRRLQDLSDSYFWIAAVDPDGRVRVATDGLFEGESIAERPVFARAREAVYVGAPHPSMVLGPAAAARGMRPPGELADLGMPLVDADGRPRGVLAAHLSAAHLETLRNVVLGHSMDRRELELALVGPEGRVLVGSLPTFDAASPGVGLDTRAAARRVDTGGREQVVAGADVSPPRGVPAFGWTVVATQPLDAALAPVNDLQRTLLVIGGVLALLLGGVGVWLSRRVARPLTDMFDVVGEHLGLDSPLSSAGYLRVLTEAMRRLPPAREQRAPGERMLDQLVHDADRLHLVLDRLPAPVYLLDRSMRVVFWNQRASEAFGWTAAEAIGRPVVELIPPDDASREAVEALRRRFAVEDGPWEIDAHILTRYGGDFWGRWNIRRVSGVDGAPIGMLALVRDRTAEVRSEAQQREQSGMLAGIVESATDAIVSVGSDGRITLFNPAAERVFGWTAASMIGQPLDRLLPPDVAAAHAGDMLAFAQSRATRRPMGRGIVRGVRADGRELALEAAISQVTVARRQVLTAILRDVTERLRDERALDAYRQDLAALTRRLMDQEKRTTQRLAQMLHDQLGQTLVAARMNAEALMVAMRDRWPPGEQVRAERLAALVEGAQQEVRGALVELRPPLLDESGLASALETELRLRAPAAEPVRLLLDVDSTVRAQRWAPDVEYAAFMVAREALGNALLHANATEIVVALWGDSGEIRLEVRDDGVGLAEGALAPRPGHLGLVGMRERALAVGAQVSMRPREGGGTAVRFIWELQG